MNSYSAGTPGYLDLDTIEFCTTCRFKTRHVFDARSSERQCSQHIAPHELQALHQARQGQRGAS
jgi:hypothetical protein